jgi:hypothetical protein
MRSVTRQVVPRYILVATALIALGCDPGYRFRPVKWIEQPERQWSRDFDGFSLRTHYLGGLVGEWWLAPTFEVVGNSERVSLTAASLHTDRGRYPGVIDSRKASVASGGGRLRVHWDFGRGNPAPEVLGERAQIILDLIVGSRPQKVGIEYERTSCCL